MSLRVGRKLKGVGHYNTLYLVVQNKKNNVLYINNTEGDEERAKVRDTTQIRGEKLLKLCSKLEEVL